MRNIFPFRIKYGGKDGNQQEYAETEVDLPENVNVFKSAHLPLPPLTPVVLAPEGL